MKNKNEFKFLYENDEDFTALPTYYILPALEALMTSSHLANAVPGKTIELSQVLHGEQYIEFFGKIPFDGKLISKFGDSEVLDKGSGAALVQNSMLLFYPNELHIWLILIFS